MDEKELQDLEKRAESWDASIATEVPRLIEIIRELKKENESLKLFLLKAKKIEDERDVAQDTLNKTQDILREIAKLVSEYSEENEITSLDAHRKIEETIKRFLEGQ
jgi:adenylate kinase family enzyme